MADFDPAFERMMDIEDPDRKGKVTYDTGKTTRWGISSRAFPEVNVAILTLPEARSLYRIHYWNQISGDSIKSQAVANELFEAAVNCGVGTAIRFAQRAYNVLRVTGEPILVDGWIGDKTRAALNDLSRRYESALVAAMNGEQYRYYATLVETDPEQFASSIRGWMRRVR